MRKREEEAGAPSNSRQLSCGLRPAGEVIERVIGEFFCPPTCSAGDIVFSSSGGGGGGGGGDGKECGADWRDGHDSLL
nr:unnamed protein product [Digitaria exilis]